MLLPVDDLDGVVGIDERILEETQAELLLSTRRTLAVDRSIGTLPSRTQSEQVEHEARLVRDADVEPAASAQRTGVLLRRGEALVDEGADAATFGQHEPVEAQLSEGCW